jgi:vesicle coat complex subunit
MNARFQFAGLRLAFARDPSNAKRKPYPLTILIVALLVMGCGRKPPYEGRSVAELERMLADSNPAVQVQGAFGLSRLLKSTDALVRQQACVALGSIGAAAEKARPALLTALADPEWTVRRQAALALGRIGPLSAVETPLKNCTRDSNSLVRKAAAEALATLRKGNRS